MECLEVGNASTILIKSLYHSEMKKFPKIIAVSIPIVLFIVLVNISTGSVNSHQSALSILDSPSGGIFGFGFWEERVHLIAILFPVLLMFIGSVDKNSAKVN